jgi:hypothetical protein
LALYLTDGKVVLSQQEIINDINAYITTELPASNSIQETYAKIDVKCKVPALHEEKRVYINLELFNGSGKCSMKTANDNDDDDDHDGDNDDDDHDHDENNSDKRKNKKRKK